MLCLPLVVNLFPNVNTPENNRRSSYKNSAMRGLYLVVLRNTAICGFSTHDLDVGPVVRYSDGGNWQRELGLCGLATCTCR